MSPWLLPFVLALAPMAGAQDPAPAEPAEERAEAPAAPAEEEPPEPPEPPATERRLELAVRAYQAGRYEEARTELALLVNDGSIEDRELKQQARVYLGELLYVQGQEDAAFKVFETVLQEEPEYRVDPFRHPPDVCGFFEVVRASTSVLAPPPPPRALVRPAPLGVYTGFGIWQRAHGRRGLANVLLTGQLLLGAASVAGFAWIRSDDEYVAGSPDEQRLKALRALQWSATAGFWGLYAWGTLNARHDARTGDGASAVELAPAAGLGVSGRW